MATDLDKIATDLLALPPLDREELACRLMASLQDAPDSDVERAWIEIAERRSKELAEGKVQGVPVEDALRRLRERVG